ncbi:MAG: thioredoxin family protein [Breznakia sp.]
MKELMKPLTSLEEFEVLYKKDTTTMFVFSANWCPDCVFIEAFMPKLIQKYSQIEFIYVDRDAFIDLSQGLGIMGIPSFLAIRSSKEIGRFVSKLRKSEAEIDRFFAEVSA